MSVSVDDERCLHEYLDIVDPVYVMSVPGAQFLASFACLLLIISFFTKFAGKGCFHRNAKVLIFWQLLNYVIMCAIFIGTNGEHLYRFFLSPEVPCSFFKLSLDCTYIFHTYVLVLVFIGIERVISTIYSKQYESFSIALSIAMVICSIVFSTLLQFWFLDGMDPLEFRLGCFGIPLKGGLHTNSLFVMMLICNGVSLGLFMLTLLIMYLKVEKNGYELNANYQKVEHFRLLKMFLPNVLIQSVFYGFYCLSTMIARSMFISQNNGLSKTIFMRHNDLPYCAMIEVLLMHWIMKRAEDNRRRFKSKISRVCDAQVGEIYFQSLAQQWNSQVGPKE